MQQKPVINSVLQGKRIALPESRRLDVLTDLFQRRGARVQRVPLIAILDAPDPAPVTQWLTQFCQSPPDYFVILTGEGIRRLRDLADRQMMLPQFLAALANTCKICRGPKPQQVLKQLGLQADLQGESPTTAGIIATLRSLQLRGLRVAVQLYGEDPNPLLMDYLAGQGLAACHVVAPYVYASDSDTEQVKSLILALSAGAVDAIAFTSQPQIRRLVSVASAQNLSGELNAGMRQTKVAAIGPIVAGMLREHGFRVDTMPAGSYFMKPLVTAIEQLFKADAEH